MPSDFPLAFQFLLPMISDVAAVLDAVFFSYSSEFNKLGDELRVWFEFINIHLQRLF